MTQLFTYQGFSFRTAPLSLRLLVTAFLVMASLGVLVGFANYQVRTGLSSRGSGAWYRQGEAWVEGAQESAAGADAAGATANRAGGGVGLYAKTPLELLDATHPHLFNQAFLFFVLGHLLALCSMKAWRKNAVFLAGFGGVLLDASSPWLIRYASAGFSWAQLLGHILMAVAFVALVLVPLREMWWRGRA